jgi:hypothetical protein
LIPLVGLILLAGCARYSPPSPPTPRDATNVMASFGRTWDATLNEFADRNIPIRTIDRASGLVLTEQLMASSDTKQFADCGRRGAEELPATQALYNVLVHGDSQRATVKITMQWTYVSAKVSRECSTLHRWERQTEDEIRQRAERALAEATAAPDTEPVRPARVAKAPAAASTISIACDSFIPSRLPEADETDRRLYVGDLQRNGVVECVDQAPPNVVRVLVAPGYRILQPERREAYLARLYAMYRSWGNVYMELWGDGGKFGEYLNGRYQASTSARRPGQQ